MARGCFTEDAAPDADACQLSAEAKFIEWVFIQNLLLAKQVLKEASSEAAQIIYEYGYYVYCRRAQLYHKTFLNDTWKRQRETIQPRAFFLPHG